jgi:hypothetical protein
MTVQHTPFVRVTKPVHEPELRGLADQNPSRSFAVNTFAVNTPPRVEVNP